MTITEERPKTRPTPKKHTRIIPFVLVLLGVLAFAYPVVVTQYNNARQQEFAQRYGNQITDVEPAELGQDLAAARQYNTRIGGVPILDPWLTRVSSDPNSPDYQQYLTQLDSLSAMARLRVPSIGVDLPIYHGTSDDVLGRGIGHLYGTSLPVGGAGTHAALTGHTGLATATLLDHLEKVEVGEVFYVEVAGETLAYQVDQITVVLPTELDDLLPVAGQDLVTLVTCTPYSVNSHRLLVRGHRVPYEEAIQVSDPEEAVSPFTLEPWMWWLIGGAGAGLVVLGGMAVAGRKPRKTQLGEAVEAPEAPQPAERGEAPQPVEAPQPAEPAPTPPDATAGTWPPPAKPMPGPRRRRGPRHAARRRGTGRERRPRRH
ncbi:MAG: class C sortase [bacterium]|nr:class C sortase [bacterium]